MATSTTASSTTSSAAESIVTALTTTFTPPARCTESSMMFTMLAPRYEIWVNEPVPVSGSTVSSCYPSEWLDNYSTTSLSSLATPRGSSVVPAMTPLVCPLSWETALTAAGNYIACCPPGFSLDNPKTTVDGYRPGYGATCYSQVPSGTVLSTVTQYNNKSISGTLAWTATAVGQNVYAHPIDGYALRDVSVTVTATANSSTAATTTTSSTSLASSTQSSTSAAVSKSSGSGLSGGAIAGVVIGVIAGVTLLAALLFFLLRRRRTRAGLQGPVTELGDESNRGSGVEQSVVEVKSPVTEIDTRERRTEIDTVFRAPPPTELSGEIRAPAELDGGSFPVDRKA